jgi:hypothetical protein
MERINGRFAPGLSGNPSGLPGRPLGSRQVFSPGFLRDFAEVWRDHGRETMMKTATDQPALFFATCARLLLTTFGLTIEQTLPGKLSMEDWTIMREIIAGVSSGHSDCCWRSARSRARACAGGAKAGRLMLRQLTGALFGKGSQKRPGIGSGYVSIAFSVGPAAVRLCMRLRHS